MGVRNTVWPKLAIADPAVPRMHAHRPRWIRPVIGLGLALLALLTVDELRTSRIQSKVLAGLSSRLRYGLAKGPSATPIAAPAGPYDQRLGYSGLPEILAHLDSKFEISAQATNSTAARRLASLGAYPVYDEKSQAGLRISGRSGAPLFLAQYPSHVYTAFDDIPPLVVKSLLYIENRNVLEDSPTSNPAVEWHRLAKAVGDLTINTVYPAHPISGGSTLATQLEKVRHSPAGRTSSASDKFWQMMTASLRAYRRGENTTLTRREIVRDYLNSFPLGAVPGYGEVAGLQEGLRVWFGADVEGVNRLLHQVDASNPVDEKTLDETAAAYRQTLTLLLALNRPTYYLREDKVALDKRVDSFLRLFRQKGLISEKLMEKALATRTTVARRFHPNEAGIEKGTLALRTDLLGLFGIPDSYALDRLDVAISSTFDESAQRGIARQLAALSNPAVAASEGLTGANLLGPSDDGSVIYSFSLYESTPDANLLRVETDSYNQPLSMNRGTRLELGSTAKLRTLITYLEIITELHSRFEAGELTASVEDPLSKWAYEYLSTAPSRDLAPMLESALDRVYSASPAERFYTGGGLHTFSNFDSKDNGARITVREGFRRSVNLVFIRLMRDVVRYHESRLAMRNAGGGIDSSARSKLLERFIDQESSVFLDRFWRKYQGQSVEEAVAALGATQNANLRRLSVLYRTVFPGRDPEELQAFLNAAARTAVSGEWARELHTKYSPEHLSWNDLGYLAGVHPLELWVLRYRSEHPNASYASALKASETARRETYAWLRLNKNIQAQNIRIQTIVEQDAFRQILASWKRQGYPFDDIVPSYASALGSSGDNPAALTELAGIILNDGVRKPARRLRSIHFAEGTPYETLLEAKGGTAQRVLPVELAQVVKRAMFDVVDNGTARRAHGSLLDHGTIIPIGGKTGTGDNRLEIRRGSGVESRAINRTATFVFLVGDRFYGTITAYVPGREAENYRFTSALPVQIFRKLAPILTPVVAGDSAQASK